MPFRCEITFTGVCSFVPNAPLNGNPTKMCVVLVDGTKAEATLVRAIDGTRLRRHRAFLRYDVKDIAGHPSPPKTETKGVWYLDKKRVTVEATGAPALTTTYTTAIDAINDVSSPQPGTEQDFAWLAGMTKIAPTFAAMEAAAVTSAPPVAVLGQVLFDKGLLRAAKPEKEVWVFNSLLSGVIVRRPIAHAAVLELADLTKLVFVGAALPGGVADSLELSAPDGGLVKVTIANLCEQNPLQWDVTTSNPQDDEDFRWHFQLLEHHRANIDIMRRGLSLPIPLLEKNRVQPAATGVNCFPGRFANLSF